MSALVPLEAINFNIPAIISPDITRRANPFEFPLFTVSTADSTRTLRKSAQLALIPKDQLQSPKVTFDGIPRPELLAQAEQKNNLNIQKPHRLMIDGRLITKYNSESDTVGDNLQIVYSFPVQSHWTNNVLQRIVNEVDISNFCYAGNKRQVFPYKVGAMEYNGMVYFVIPDSFGDSRADTCSPSIPTKNAIVLFPRVPVSLTGKIL
jgi:hypothetical protein